MAPKQPVAGPSRTKASSVQAPPPSPSVSAFSPSGSLYACAQPVLGAADKISVWDVTSDRVIAEFELEGAAKATTVNWSSISGAGPSKKKRRKSEPNAVSEEALVVTTGSGSLLAFSPRRGERIRQLDIGFVTAGTCTDHGNLFATSKELLYLDADLFEITARFQLQQTNVTALSILPTSTREKLHVLIGASSTIIHLHLDLSTNKIAYSGSPLPVSTTSVSSIHPRQPSKAGSSFLVVSQDDRTVSQYTLPSPTSPAKLSYRYATPTLSPVHSCTLSPTLLSVTHYSGEVSLFDLPTELDLVRPKSGQSSTVRIVSGKQEQLATLCGTTFPDEGVLICGRLLGGGRIKWLRATYELPEGGIAAETVVKADAQELIANGTTDNVQTQRFAAPAAIEVPAQDNTEPTSTLPADVDMADLTLGERLLALPNGDTEKAAPKVDGPVNAASLTRLLVQALHTSDPALLNLVLTHRDPVLIRNTIRKLPPTMALPLLKACIERLGQGKGVNSRGGGRGVGQNEQQARGTIQWVKGCLIERSAMLQTVSGTSSSLRAIPSSVERLEERGETECEDNWNGIRVCGIIPGAVSGWCPRSRGCTALKHDGRTFQPHLLF